MTVWLLLLYGLTAVSTGFNAQYFWAYRSTLAMHRAARRRRLAALVLALLHGALFLENACFSAAYLFGQPIDDGWLILSMPLVLWLPLRAFLMAASAGVTLLLVRSPSPANRRR